jgi:hypothetical protein
MTKTEKSNTNTRKGPPESATAFSVGTVKRGNDGNMWKIITTVAGIHRWSIIKGNNGNNSTANTSATKKNKTVKKRSSEDAHTQSSIKPSKEDISLTELKKLATKYSVLSSGKSKSQLALLIYNISSHSMTTPDLERIVHLLPGKEKRKAKQLIDKQRENPITDYKGMWKPLPKPLNKMSRREMIRNLRNFRDAWEKETGRNQDLSDERLDGETDKTLRQLLGWFYTDAAKNIAANWIRENM